MNPVTGLALGRIAVGVASLARPDLAASLLRSDGGSPLMTQWFGSREIAIGAATLLASGTSRRNLVLIGVAIDAADALTAASGVRAEQLPPAVGYGLTAVAAGAVVQGLLGLRVRRAVVVDAA